MHKELLPVFQKFSRGLSLLLVFLFVTLFSSFSQESNYKSMPFSTNQNQFTVWNGEQYVPFFVKGVNLGVAVPGTFPGELAAQKEDYFRWFGMIREAGFNAIRLYTLHYPRFYEALDSFNLENPNRPIYFFQGIWIEEEIPGYQNDLFELKPAFDEEMIGNISAVHGDISLAYRPGKAWGEFTADVSKYLIGYVVGREIYPNEVWTTNANHPDSTSFDGEYFAINNVFASEVFMSRIIDNTIKRERDLFGESHPISFSSWPTLDPLHHPEEVNTDEDSVSIDLSSLTLKNDYARYFASYHAYPYYPDFIGKQPNYQQESDYIGQNSYLAYIKDLKSHYQNFPLLIAEFGTSSSWGIAHYGQNGIHHGGANEIQQGKDYIRMFKNFQEANLAGGVQFAWIDEWFKRTWITDPLDPIADRRILWHNVTAAEQNFGLLGYEKNGDSLENWKQICNACAVTDLEAGTDFSFFNLKLKLLSEFSAQDTMWIAFDTYADSLGEVILPDGQTLNRRAEFALRIVQDEATLFVTEAYDLFGIWHGTSGPEQLYHSTASNGEPWKVVRWKNNNSDNEVQYIGKLGVNRLNLPEKSTDAVIIKDTSIFIRLPWTLLQYMDPSQRVVIHDDRNTPVREDSVSAGIGVSIRYQGLQYDTDSRYQWDTWDVASDYREYTKKSYNVIVQELSQIQSDPIAHADSFLVEEELIVAANESVLNNDIVYTMNSSKAKLMVSPENGLLQLDEDGSFTYTPINGFTGLDSFYYAIENQNFESVPVRVLLDVRNSGDPSDELFVESFPNPTTGIVQLKSATKMTEISVYNGMGQILQELKPQAKTTTLDLSEYASDAYFIRVSAGSQTVLVKIVRV